MTGMVPTHPSPPSSHHDGTSNGSSGTRYLPAARLVAQQELLRSAGRDAPLLAVNENGHVLLAAPLPLALLCRVNLRLSFRIAGRVGVVHVSLRRLVVESIAAQPWKASSRNPSESPARRTFPDPSRSHPG